MTGTDQPLMSDTDVHDDGAFSGFAGGIDPTPRLSATDIVEAHIEPLERTGSSSTRSSPIALTTPVRRPARSTRRSTAPHCVASRWVSCLRSPACRSRSRSRSRSSACPTPPGAGARSRRASRSATAVQRLVDAGAIPLGVTNISELTLWIESENPLYGRTNNPYDRRRTAGGSSGGEGAAVAPGVRCSASAPISAARSACRRSSAGCSATSPRRGLSHHRDVAVHHR